MASRNLPVKNIAGPGPSIQARGVIQIRPWSAMPAFRQRWFTRRTVNVGKKTPRSLCPTPDAASECWGEVRATRTGLPSKVRNFGLPLTGGCGFRQPAYGATGSERFFPRHETRITAFKIHLSLCARVLDASSALHALWPHRQVPAGDTHVISLVPRQAMHGPLRLFGPEVVRRDNRPIIKLNA